MPGSPAEAAGVAFAAGRFAEAAALLDAALQASPADAVLLCNRGLCRQRLGHLDAAIADLREATRLNPAFGEAWVNLGDSLREARQPEEADAALRRALQLDPRMPSACMGLGLLWQQYGRVGAAIGLMRQALAGRPDLADYWCNLASALTDLGELGAARNAYARAIELVPEHAAAQSNLLMCLQYEPDLSARRLRQAAQAWGDEAVRAAPALPPPASRRPGPLRVGYVSGDFMMHPVGWLFLPVAAAHDRAVVQVFCYANQARSDALTGRIRAAADVWREVQGLDDATLCACIRDDDIDVLVDLSGHTAGGRLGVFARGAARVRLSWLGYFASVGLPNLDGMILGRDQAGPAAEAYFVEPVERLARSQFSYAPPDYAPVPQRRAGAGPVFGSFGNVSKINTGVLRTWASLLQALPRARLLLKWKTFGDADAAAAMRGRLAAAGADLARVELRGPSPHAEMLGEYGDIDVALDPFPFSGGLTTFEALWMGVPVVTLEGVRPASRQTSALLRALALDDLVTDTPRRYVETCAKVAADIGRLADLRGGMRERMAAAGLLDGPALARELEAVYLRHARRVGIA